MKLQLSSMMMANSIRSCAQAPRQIDRCSTASNHLASPTCSAKSRANNDEQLESIWSSHSVSYFPSLAGVAFRAPNATGLIQVCFSQIFGFLFQNCSVYCLLGRCLALPCTAPSGTAQGLTCLALCSFACLTYILNILPRFLIFFSCVCHKKQKMPLSVASFRLVSSSSLQALWLRLFPFFIIFQIPICVFFSKGATSFYCLQNHRLASIWKNEETRAQISLASVCVCAPNLVFF